MAQIQIDTTPKPHFLLAEQHAKWTVHGAISELVDNSFGAKRGNAQKISIYYDRAKRDLILVDDGVGMDDIARLFQLGNTIGRSPKDIGIYGAGGTKAILWLAETVSVQSLHKGFISRAKVTWKDLMKGEKLEPIIGTREKATEANTPPALLRNKSGTRIHISLLKSRNVIADKVQQALAQTYAPALREGRQILWFQSERSTAPSRVLLQPPYTFTKSVKLRFNIKHDDQTLRVRGEIGIVGDELTVERNRIAIEFGPRVIFSTRECFSSEGERFSGRNITGWVNLGDGWPDYMTTTKDAIDDANLHNFLMKAIFARIRPLLAEIEDEEMTLLMNDLALNLELSLNGDRHVDVSIGPEAEGTEKVVWIHDGEKPHRPGTKPPVPAEDGVEVPLYPLAENGQKSKRPGVAKIRIEPRSDHAMEGVLCSVEITPHDIVAYVNRDHEIVEEARRSRPTNRLLLNLLITREIADALKDNPAMVRALMGQKVVTALAEIDEHKRERRLARILIDRAIKPKLDAAE